MLIASGVEKILVCAPSNAAIDEVVTRLHNKGMVGVDL
jgi:ABC-type sugar transport system substrate-binding protein